MRTTITTLFLATLIALSACSQSLQPANGSQIPANASNITTVLDPDQTLDSAEVDEGGHSGRSPRFVAVGYAVHTSDDGVNWTRQDVRFDNQAGAVHGNGRVFVVGQGGKVVMSQDGSRWSEIAVEGEKLRGVRAVAYNGKQFVAVGSAFDGLLVGVISTSPDGINWTARQAGFARGFGLVSVTHGEGTFVTVGAGIIGSSSDGITWEKSDFRYPIQLFDVAYGNGRFVATGGRGSVYSSPDGVTWREGRSGLSDVFFLHSVTYGDGQFVAAGEEMIDRGEFVPGEGYGPERPTLRSAIITSHDGVDWNIQHTGTSQELTDIAYGDNQFIVIGNNEGPTDEWGNPTSYNAVVLTSNNGTDWTETEVGGRSVRGEEGSFRDSSRDNPSVWLSSVIYWPDADES